MIQPCSWTLEVPLTAEEPIGVARQRAPVSSGICFPRGQVQKDQAFTLLEGDREIPLQVTPLVVEKDGSLRWALLDFQIDLAAKETKRLFLRSGRPAVSPSLQLQATETAATVTINTGPMIFVVGKTKPFTLLEKVQLGAKTIVPSGAVEFIEGKTGERYVAGPPRQVSFEYHGPLKVTLRVEGVYDGAGDCRLGYITRITAWAGQTALRVQHILVNSNRDQVYYANVRSAALSLRHGFSGEAQAMLGAQSISAKLDQVTSLWLHQGKVNRYYQEPIRDAVKAGSGDTAQWSGADSAGWAALREGNQALFVCDRDFTGDPPRKLVVDKERVTLEFISSKFNEGRGVPFASDHLWLYDLSHKVADLWIDFAATGDFAAQSQACRERLLAFAPADWYSQCDVFGVGRFGTLDDEKKVYEQWGWKYEPRQLPRRTPNPEAFVRWEDNHYESEADSAEALLLMSIRTGQRGYFDQGEAWAQYHANLHAWRTDGWVYDDGAIWFPQGGPLGTKPARRPGNVKYQQWDKGSGDDKELWRQSQAKACYCHFYGAGLVDYFLLTGEHDALEAAIDLAEQKNSEFRKHRGFTPGKSTISDTRGFGRGFYVITHLLEAVPEHTFVADLARLCRDVLWHCPTLDERGFAPCHIGTGFGGFDPKRDLKEGMKAFMEKEGVSLDEKGWLTDRAGNRWPVVCLGGTWQHAYVQAAADRYARLFQDEDMRDFTDAFGRFTAKFMLSEKCKLTWYYAYMDIPTKGKPWDPWQFEAPHTTTKDGDGCQHDGYYTRFFPDAIAMAFSVSGDPSLLHRAREFWHYGSKRGYQTKRYSAGVDAVGMFANHVPPKDDSVLSTSRLFYEWAHPRKHTTPPGVISDLAVTRLPGGKFEISFTAPADAAGSRVAHYQLKCAELPLLEYNDYDFARDDGKKRNFWRAVNLVGEPQPSSPGSKEKFVVTGVPEKPELYFVLVSLDESNNRSRLSNLVKVAGK